MRGEGWRDESMLTVPEQHSGFAVKKKNSMRWDPSESEETRNYTFLCMIAIATRRFKENVNRK